MKVYLVNGSPNERGCTYTALQEVGKGLAEYGVETETFWVGNQPVPDCIACEVCGETGAGCVFQDEVNHFAELARDADGFVFGSPVYFASANAALGAFMDRLFYSSSHILWGKPAAAIVSCRRSGGSAALDRLNKYLLYNGMPLAASTYWNVVHGNTPEEVRQDLEGLQTMRNLGRSLGFLVKSAAVARENGVEPPRKERIDFTNFIR